MVQATIWWAYSKLAWMIKIVLLRYRYTECIQYPISRHTQISYYWFLDFMCEISIDIPIVVGDFAVLVP